MALAMAKQLSPLRTCIFQYRPLPPDRWYRLLTLIPGTGLLRCSLSDHEVDRCVLEYQALSYVWGTEGPCHAILCNGRLLAVGRNLATALYALRDARQATILWVDAICINQQDDDERSQQVSVMGAIYTNAQSVFVWLGDDPMNEAQCGFDLISNTIKTVAQLLDLYGSVDHIPSRMLAEQLCQDPIHWLTVTRLMEREWFFRVWVIQEVGLARRVTVGCGRARMDWSELVEFALFITSRPDVSSRIGGHLRCGSIWDTFETMWASFGNQQTWRNDRPLCKSLNETAATERSLMDILNGARLFRATDPHDYVYAFASHPKAVMGLDSHGEPRCVKSNYHLSVDEVFLDAAASILETGHDTYTVLSCVDHVRRSPSLHSHRPSWVPRWDEGFRVYWLGYPENWCRAGGEQAEDFRDCIDVHRESGCLSIRGSLIDNVASVSSSFDVDTSDQVTRPQKLSPDQMFGLLRHNRTASPYGPSMDEQELAYSLVLVAGRAADDGPAEDNMAEHRAVYHAYREALTARSKEIALSPEAIRAERNPVFSSSLSSEPQSRLGEDETSDLQVKAYESNQRRALTNRRLFQSSKGFYGIGHSELKVGDECMVVKGSSVPFLLRQVHLHELNPEQQRHVASTTSNPSPRAYRLVGECYIQGVMRGELFNSVGCEVTDTVTETTVLLF